MGRRYGGVGTAAVGTNKTILNLFNGSAVARPRVYDILIACGATPADLATIFHVGRSSAVGTEGSGYTPVEVDPGDPASTMDFGVAHSAEPTYTANKTLLKIAMNQRATVRWVAAPGGELVGPVTANNGLGLFSLSSGGTAAHDATMHFEE